MAISGQMFVGFRSTPKSERRETKSQPIPIVVSHERRTTMDVSANRATEPGFMSTPNTPIVSRHSLRSPLLYIHNDRKKSSTPPPVNFRPRSKSESRAVHGARARARTLFHESHENYSVPDYSPYPSLFSESSCLLTTRRQSATLTDSIKKSVPRLEKLAEECHAVNSDLSSIVETQHRLLRSHGCHMELDCLHQIGRLNKTAVRDIKRACVAYYDYLDTVTELRDALSEEEKEVAERAGQLKKGSLKAFSKVKPEAVARIHSTSLSEDEDRGADNDSEDNIDYYLYIYGGSM